MQFSRTMMIAVLAAAAAGAWPDSAEAQAEKKPDLTGRWQFSVQSDVGSGSPTVTFALKGDSLTGRYSSQALGERDFVGTFKDGKLNFWFNAEVGGQQFSMSFSGTLAADDAMQGSIDFGGMGSGTFTGKRQKP